MPTHLQFSFQKPVPCPKLPPVAIHWLMLLRHLFLLTRRIETAARWVPAGTEEGPLWSAPSLPTSSSHSSLGSRPLPTVSVCYLGFRGAQTWVEHLPPSWAQDLSITSTGCPSTGTGVPHLLLRLLFLDTWHVHMSPLLHPSSPPQEVS